MPHQALPPEEPWRLEAMGALGPLDPALSERFDHVSRTAARLFKVPMALVSLVEDYRRRFPSRAGSDGAAAGPELSGCGDLFPADDLLIIPDALADPRHSENPLVTGQPHIRFFAGCPLKGPRGDRLGTLCLLSPEPRAFSPAERMELREVASWAGLEVDRAVMEQTLAAVREGERFFRYSPDLFHLATFKGRFLKVNPAYTRVLGWSEAELLAMPIKDLIHPEDLEASKEGTRRLAQGESVLNFRHRLRHKDGSYRWITWKGFAEGEEVYGFGQDVTALLEAERALKASEANYRALVDAMAEGMVLRDGAGVVLACNPAAARMLGLPLEKILGRGYQDPYVGFIHEDGRAMAPEELPSARALREGQPIRDVVMGCIRVDGSMVWQLVTAVPMRIPEGDRVVITFADITALKRMEAQHRLVLEMTTNIIAVHDVEGRYRYVTPSIQALTGFNPEEVLGRIPHTVAHPQDQPQLINLHRQLLRGERPGALRYRITAKDGREVWIESSGNAVRDAQGRILEVVYTSRDVTQEQLANQGQARLMEIFDRSPDFVAMAAVDGTPLYANPALRSFRGIASGDSLARHHFKDSYTPEEFERIRSEAIPAAMEKGVWEGDTRLLGADGRERPASQVILAHRDVEGRVAYLSIVARDLTAHQEMEDALRHSEARFRAMLSAIPDEMFRVRRDGTYLDVHATQPGALWYPPEQFIGRTLHDILPKEVADRRLAAIHRALATREVQIITYSLTKDGRTNEFEARTMPSGEDETITIVRDLTRQKELEGAEGRPPG